MKHISTPWLALALASLLTMHVSAFDWVAAGKDLGVVGTKNTTAAPLAVGTAPRGWSNLPPAIVALKASTFVQNNPHADERAAATEYHVTKTGWVFFLGYFGFDGSAKGTWTNERWDEGRLEQEGWMEITDAECGGPLVEVGDRPWKMFAKRLTAGDTAKLRLNKYTAPRFLSFENPPAAAFAALPTVAHPISTTPRPAAPSPSSKPSPGTPATVNAPEPKPDINTAKSADLVKTYPNSLVFVQGADGAGSGFIANLNGANFLVTNAHVAVHARNATFKKLDGTQVSPGAPSGAVGHDIVRLAVAAGGSPLPIMERVEENASIGDEVVVLGNAEGAGVINTIQGKIVGVGPNLVEINAPFKPGNSGSPIIHIKTGKVIGVATYVLVRKYDSATKQAVKDPIVRRFGYRLDSVKIWQPVDWQAFYAQAAEMEAVEKLTKDLVAFLRDLGDDGRINRAIHTNPVIKNRIDQWLDAKSKHLSPRDAAMADQGMLSFLKLTCQSDVTAAHPRLTYDYFQRQLADQQRERTEIAGVFGKIIENVR